MSNKKQKLSARQERRDATTISQFDLAAMLQYHGFSSATSVCLFILFVVCCWHTFSANTVLHNDDQLDDDQLDDVLSDDAHLGDDYSDDNSLVTHDVPSNFSPESVQLSSPDIHLGSLHDEYDLDSSSTQVFPSVPAL
jgi:hypothetical protein